MDKEIRCYHRAIINDLNKHIRRCVHQGSETLIGLSEVVQLLLLEQPGRFRDTLMQTRHV